VVGTFLGSSCHRCTLNQFLTEDPLAVKGLVALLAPFWTNARGALDGVVGFLYFRRIACVG
jgi:hypothetical protein